MFLKQSHTIKNVCVHHLMHSFEKSSFFFLNYNKFSFAECIVATLKCGLSFSLYSFLTQAKAGSVKLQL